MREARGQVLPLFVLSLVAILAFTALMFDGANALVTRRRLQDAGDAAALAGSHILQAAGSIHACSASDGPPPGAPRADIVAAVRASVAQNLPGYDPSRIVVSCPAGWNNEAVQVDLRTPSSVFFGGMLGGPLNVGTTSVGVNGQITGSLYSVVELDPSNASWPNGRRGCPSVLFSGGPTVIFDGSIQVNSACAAADGGAFGTNGNSATVTLNGNARIRMVGGYDPGPLTITPAPMTGQRPVPDPFAGLPAIDMASLPVRSTSRVIVPNLIPSPAVLQPGIYRGGIELRNTAQVYMLPGIYVIDGGGLDVGAQASLYSVRAGTTALSAITPLTWSSNCADLNCGVLIYNTGTANGAGAMNSVSVAAGSIVKLRAYEPAALGGADEEYRNLLIWQSIQPLPSSTYEQPMVRLNGGGDVDIGGTVYAPSAKVQMGGNSGGLGGSTVNLTLQFISWDLEIYGNVTFHFHYTEAEFAKPTDYGLVQ